MPDRFPQTMYVTPTLHGGGAERLLTNLLLQRENPEGACVVTMWPGGVFRAPLEEAGVEVIDLGVTRRLDVVRAIWRLAALIRARRPAVVHGWMYHGNIVASLARLLAGGPKPRLFWGIFCSDLPDADLMTRIIGGVSALLSRRVDGIVYNAEEARESHRRLGFDDRRSSVIANCIDPEAFRHDDVARAAVRAELGISETQIAVAVVARIDPMKDWDSVIEAVRDLPNVVTIAVGKGTESLPPQDGLIGLGWRDDVVRILSAADIFLIGSAFGEGTSLALGEAMLCGLPCIVTDVGGNSALAGEAGIVVAPRDPAAMRAAILQLATDRARREALGRAARARATTAAPHEDSLRPLYLRSLGCEPLGCEAQA